MSPGIRLSGRILFLTQHLELIKKQLAGTDLAYSEDIPLIDNISTDEITPGWSCFNYDERLGEYVYLGLRGNPIKQGDVKSGSFTVVVSGKGKGCGSSREHSPYAEKYAGIRLVIARSFEKIYHQNCQNIGLLTSTDFGLIPRILRGEEILLEEFAQGLDPISRQIVLSGGLFNYNKDRMAERVFVPPIATGPRPMNVVEKIIAAHVVEKPGERGVPYVKPGDACFIQAGVRFSHEYVTAMGESLYAEAFGNETRMTEPQSVYVFRDHLTFLGKIMPEPQKKAGLLDQANKLATLQQSFAAKHGLRLYGEIDESGSEAICHNAVVEDLALPGQVVIGTDSHTCMAGVLGAFAFGCGTTDMANAWYTKDIRVRVPEVVRYVLKGNVREGVAAKDIMLYILATPFIREGKGIGKVLEFAGEALGPLTIDERATLTNMSVEAGAFTGIIEPDEVTVNYVTKMRALDPERIRQGCLRSDPDAPYAAVFEIDVSQIQPMIALPGDPRNGIPIGEFKEEVSIDIAYGGSCTGGKKSDMDMYAAVLKQAVEEGRQVHPKVQLFIQFGSQKIKQYAKDKGYDEIFQKAGAHVIDPSCGACIRAGPGASTSPEQVTISAQNRNFPGRSGPGKMYLASPYTVVASAIAGKVVPFEMAEKAEREVAKSNPP